MTARACGIPPYRHQRRNDTTHHPPRGAAPARAAVNRSRKEGKQPRRLSAIAPRRSRVRLAKALHLADAKHECAPTNDHLQERKAVAERIVTDQAKLPFDRAAMVAQDC